jgi:hypothetical protein
LAFDLLRVNNKLRKSAGALHIFGHLVVVEPIVEQIAICSGTRPLAELADAALEQAPGAHLLLQLLLEVGVDAVAQQEV